MDENIKPRTIPQPRGRDEELYAQIAAGDEIQVQTKPRSSWIMSLMVEYMRLTLAIDLMRRNYQKPFRILNICWSSFMSAIYLCGLGMFAILLGSYLQFPNYIKEQLKNNDILYDRIDIPGHIISRIKLHNLHDKNNTYQIEELDISSTFADFLNRRIKDLSIKGGRLTFDNRKSLSFLTNILDGSDFSMTGKNIRVDSLKIADSEIILEGEGYKIPINISLTGVYGRETNISSYISIEQPAFSLKGPLSIRNIGKELIWDLKIQNGKVLFPKRPQENLSGSIILKTTKNDIKKISANLNLTYDKIRKELDLTLDKKGKLLNGKLGLKWLDVSNALNPQEQTNLSLGISQLSINEKGRLEISGPLRTTFSTKLSNLQLENLKGDLNGILTCDLPKSCVYHLQKKASLNIKSLQFPIPEGIWVNSNTSTVVLAPSEKMMLFSFSDGQLELNTDISSLLLTGKEKQDNREISIAAKKLQLKTLFNLWDKYLSIGVSSDQLDYKSQTYEVLNATLNMNNIFDPAQKIYFNAPHIQLKETAYLNFPFQLNYIKENNLTSILLNKKNDFNLSFIGYLDLSSGDIDGQFIMPKFKLSSFINKDNNNKTLPLIEGLKNMSGEMAAYGKLTGNKKTGINGPFYIALSNANIETEDIQIQGINTVLSMQSLLPFTTFPKQQVSIKNLQSILPISNIEMELRLENRFAQLSSLTADIAGIPFSTEETLIPYKNVATLIYLKNDDNDLSEIKKSLSIPNWQVIGDLYGSIFLPIEVKNLALSVKNTSIQLSDATFKYTGKPNQKPSFLGKDNQFFVRNGNILLDASQSSQNEVNTTFLMDILLGNNGKVKKNIRETITGDLSQLVKFENRKPKPLSKNIETQIQKVFQNIETLQTK